MNMLRMKNFAVDSIKYKLKVPITLSASGNPDNS